MRLHCTRIRLHHMSIRYKDLMYKKHVPHIQEQIIFLKFHIICDLKLMIWHVLFNKYNILL